VENHLHIRRDHALATLANFNTNTLRQFALKLLRRKSSTIGVMLKRLKAPLDDRLSAKAVLGQ
jgi:hypothetical protein